MMMIKLNCIDLKNVMTSSRLFSFECMQAVCDLRLQIQNYSKDSFLNSRVLTT